VGAAAPTAPTAPTLTRALIQNIFLKPIDFRPQLTELRELEIGQKVFNESQGEDNKRKFIMKTIQTWFNDYNYDWSGKNNHTLVFPHLLKLTKRLELATQLEIGLNRFAATEYQVCS